MSQVWNFTVERRQASGWAIPEENRETYQLGDPRLREYWRHPWMHDGKKARDAFFGDAPLFGFQDGYPPGPTAEGWRDRLENAATNGHRIAWIGYEDLMIDQWDDANGILLTALVPNSVAHLFGLGDGAFPDAALLAHPMANQSADGDVLLLGGRLFPWRDAQRATTPLDHIDGTAHYTYRKTPADHPVPVTWQSSVTWWLMNVAMGLKAYRRFGDDKDLRVIAVYG